MALAEREVSLFFWRKLITKVNISNKRIDFLYTIKLGQLKRLDIIRQWYKWKTTTKKRVNLLFSGFFHWSNFTFWYEKWWKFKRKRASNYWQLKFQYVFMISSRMACGWQIFLDAYILNESGTHTQQYPFVLLLKPFSRIYCLRGCVTMLQIVTFYTVLHFIDASLNESHFSFNPVSNWNEMKWNKKQKISTVDQFSNEISRDYCAKYHIIEEI